MNFCSFNRTCVEYNSAVGVLDRNKNPDLGLSSPDPESPFLNFLPGEFELPAGKSPRWIVIEASDPREHSFRTCTTSECDIPRTDLELISISTSPSCKVLHLGRSKIFLTFWPNAESAMVKPKPMPPFVMGTVMISGFSMGLPLPNKSALEGLKIENVNFVKNVIFEAIRFFKR